MNLEANSRLLRPYAVLVIRNYSIKRTIVKEGKRTSVTDTPSGEVTPTQETETGKDDPQIADEKQEKSPSDLEKGLERDEDVKDEKEGPKE